MLAIRAAMLGMSSLWSMPARIEQRPEPLYPAMAGEFPLHLVTDEVAEGLPRPAIETHQAHLLQRTKIRRAGVDGDTRQQHRQREIVNVGRLAHDVLAAEVIAALLQDMH